MNRSRSVLNLILLIICAVIAFLATRADIRSWAHEQLFGLEVNAVNFVNYNAQEDRMYWSLRIDNAGARKARIELEEKFRANKDFRVQHTAAHIFGGLLYEKFSLAGVAECSALFNFGCYHQFFGLAISSLGVDALNEVGKSCGSLSAMARGNCFHGVGHGVIGSIGYDLESLKMGLAACDTLTSDTAPNGQEGVKHCHEGVFMEYNAMFLKHSPDIYGGGGRIFVGDMYAPCSSLESTYQPGCYFAQAAWWFDIEHDYEKVGRLCGSLADKQNREFCFRGSGKNAAWFFPENTAKIKLACAHMTEKSAITLCLNEAASTAILRTGNKEFASELCKGQTIDGAGICSRIISSNGDD